MERCQFWTTVHHSPTTVGGNSRAFFICTMQVVQLFILFYYYYKFFNGILKGYVRHSFWAMTLCGLTITSGWVTRVKSKLRELWGLSLLVFLYRFAKNLYTYSLKTYIHIHRCHRKSNFSFFINTTTITFIYVKYKQHSILVNKVWF